ncbi:hypothetical protein SB764_13590 [Paraburkholderia sp. SIMBA_027]
MTLRSPPARSGILQKLYAAHRQATGASAGEGALAYTHDARVPGGFGTRFSRGRIDLTRTRREAALHLL